MATTRACGGPASGSTDGSACARASPRVCTSRPVIATTRSGPERAGGVRVPERDHVTDPEGGHRHGALEQHGARGIAGSMTRSSTT